MVTKLIKRIVRECWENNWSENPVISLVIERKLTEEESNFLFRNGFNLGIYWGWEELHVDVIDASREAWNKYYDQYIDTSEYWFNGNE